MAEKTLFERIIAGEIPAKLVYEDQQCVAFHDIKPQAPVHLLVIPRKPIPSTDDISNEDQSLLGHIWTIIPKLARQFDLAAGYRVVVNCGQDGGQEVPHLHFHLLGGRALKWPPG